MPITLDKKLPAVDILRSENIFVMDDTIVSGSNAYSRGFTVSTKVVKTESCNG